MLVTSFDEIIADHCYGPQFVYNFNPIVKVNGKGAARFEKDIEDAMKKEGEVIIADDNPIFGQPRWIKSESPEITEDSTILMFESLNEDRTEEFFYIYKSNKNGRLVKISGDRKVIIPISYKSDEFKIEKIYPSVFFKTNKSNQVYLDQKDIDFVKNVANNVATKLGDRAKDAASQGLAKGTALASQSFEKGMSFVNRFRNSNTPASTSTPAGGRKRRTRAKRTGKSKRRNIKGGKKTRGGKSKRRR